MLSPRSPAGSPAQHCCFCMLPIASTHMCVEAKALPPYHSHHQVARHAAFVMATNEVLSNAIRGSKCNIPQERGLGGMGEGHE